MRLLVAALLFSSCITLDPQTAYRVATRRQAADQLASCLGWGFCRPVSGADRTQCLTESRAFCQSRGLEAGCGTDDLQTRNFTCGR